MSAARDFDWASLEDHVTPSGEFRPPERPAGTEYAQTIKYPCDACGGSGKWRGGTNRNGERKCFACGGRGYFKTSVAERRHARAQRATSKANRLADAQKAFDEANPDVVAFLRDAANWSEFAADMCSKIAQYGALTERQLAAVGRMMQTVADRRAERAAERQAGNATVDLSPIRAMFESAVGHGYKRPIYRAAGLVITRAPDHGRNPGALYVTDEADDYLGKIIGTAYTGKPAPALTAIAADPRGEAIRYGQRTGRCSCCGRELTAEASIDAGIGPICASKWGL